MVASRENFPLLAELLAEQNRLDTPVARFSSAHDAANGGAGAGASTLAFGSPQLVPLSAPKPGEQYAFEVDLDSCTGCKSCVAACHSLNGLDDEETWRDVGMLVSPERRHPFTQTITTACHHCEDPGCLNGCPVLAYEKDPITGIVRHLDDQCIGCSYCVLKCPYDVPKYSRRRGIVRKCDMCHGRLAHGEAPACAQACPTQAIKITVVSVAHGSSAVQTLAQREAKPVEAAVRGSPASLHHAAPSTIRHAVAPAGAESEMATDDGSENRSDSAVCTVSGLFAGSDAGTQETVRPASDSHDSVRISSSEMSAAPNLATHAAILGDVSYTRPTTRYISRRPLPENLIPADHATARPQPAHWPLAVMLTLMGLAIGCSAFAALSDNVTYYVTFPSVVADPNVTYYVTLLGWVAGALGLAVSVLHLGQPQRAWRIFLGLRRSWLSREAMVFGIWFALASACSAERLGWMTVPVALRPALEIGTAIIGILGFFCSAMIYVDTHRQFWRLTQTAPRFFSGAAVLTVTAAFAVHSTPVLAALSIAAMMAKLLIEAQALAPLNGDRDALTPALKSARLLVGPLRSVNELRVGAAFVGGIFPAVLLATHDAPAWLAWPAFAAVLLGELLERSLFFRAFDAPKMPGVPA